VCDLVGKLRHLHRGPDVEQPAVGVPLATTPNVSSGTVELRFQRTRTRLISAARAKSPATSPQANSRRASTLLPRAACTSGASSRIAASGSSTAGSGS